jgi:cytoskeletal protein RodZ
VGKTIIGLLVIAVVAVAAYFYFQAPDEPAPMAEQVEEAPAAAEEAVESATEQAEEATDAVEEAVESVTEQAEEAVENATEQAQDAVDAVTEGAQEAVEAVTGQAEETADAAGDAFSVDGFDFDAVKDAIDNSDLGTIEKTTLGAALEGARDNPDLLRDVLGRVREALGQ